MQGSNIHPWVFKLDVLHAEACQPWQLADSLAEAEPGLFPAGGQVCGSFGVRGAPTTLRAWPLRKRADEVQIQLLQAFSFLLAEIYDG